MKKTHKNNQPSSCAKQKPGFNAAESPLYRLYSRKDTKGQSAISDLQFAAGEKLRRDYERANLERRITSSWQVAVDNGGGNSSISDNHIASLCDQAIDARKRVTAAMEAVGPELAAILYYVCCMAAGLEHAERLLNYPQRSGKAILSLALNRLARHYQILKPVKAPSHSNVAHWALTDYRPTLLPPPPLPGE